MSFIQIKCPPQSYLQLFQFYSKEENNKIMNPDRNEKKSKRTIVFMDLEGNCTIKACHEVALFDWNSHSPPQKTLPY